MLYQNLGKTGLKAAKISFGGIPIQRSTAQNTVEVVDKLEELNINYIDTARGYTVSEEYLGAALKGRREKFILATKSMSRDYEGMKKDIAISLKNLQTDHIEVYQIHNIGFGDFDKVFSSEGAFRALEEAKESGIISHIGATAHNADCLKKLVDEYGDKIETLMFPYNIIENQGEETLINAKAKGIATIAMKPLAGGNIDDYELALHYIMASPAIDIAIPGMGDSAEVIKNAAAGESFNGFSQADKAEAKKIAEKLGTTFCRRCGYCAPCTVGINIPSNFLFDNYLLHYEGLSQWAKGRYKAMDKNATDCIECGVCETRCPYNLPIREMLKKVAADFKE